MQSFLAPISVFLLANRVESIYTLVKKLPEPLRRLIGNLSDEERVLLGLDLRRKT